MERELKNVSPEYQARLEILANTLVIQRSFGCIALRDSVEVGDNESQLLLFDEDETLVV